MGMALPMCNYLNDSNSIIVPFVNTSVLVPLDDHVIDSRAIFELARC